MSEDLQARSAKLLDAHCQPLIAGRAEVGARQLREFKSTAGIALPPQIMCTTEDVNVAAKRARQAHREGYWRNLKRESRKSALLRWADLLELAGEDLALLCAAQTGRSLGNFREHSIPKAIAALRWFAELIDKTEDRSIADGHTPGYLSIIRREAIGCVAAILPWNDPLVVFMWKVAPALVCGNAVLVKTSEYAHHALVLAVKLAHEAGIPEAQLQLLTGDRDTGAAVVVHPDVDAIAFTGSSATGKWIAAEASRVRLKRVTLECGGKSAFLVSAHSKKLTEAAACLARNVFYNQGQICSAPTRAYVKAERFDEFLGHLCQQALAYRPTHPIHIAGTVGHMIHADAVQRVRMAVSEASGRGHAPVLTGDVEEPAHAIHPMIFTNVPETDALARHELFGPVLIVNKVDSMEAAIARANDSAYGLAAGLWTDDLDEAMKLSAELESGTVHVNSYGEDGNQVPFGGIKDSGQGKEKSVDTLNSYTTIKSVCIKLGKEAVA